MFFCSETFSEGHVLGEPVLFEVHMYVVLHADTHPVIRVQDRGTVASGSVFWQSSREDTKWSFQEAARASAQLYRCRQLGSWKYPFLHADRITSSQRSVALALEKSNGRAQKRRQNSYQSRERIRERIAVRSERLDPPGTPRSASNQNHGSPKAVTPESTRPGTRR